MEEGRETGLPGAMDVGIPMSMESFRALVADYTDRMEAGRAMTTDDYITMTRLWNTVEFRRLSEKDSLFHRYAAAFFPAYVERVAKGLNALPTKGMALYSKEHDLFLGGKPHPKSQYKLEEL
jgi:hypothetical protein